MAAFTVLFRSTRVNSIRMWVCASTAIRGTDTLLACPDLHNVILHRRSTNDAQKHGNHSTLWSAERLLSASLLGLVPASIAFPSDPLNYALALSLTMHAHWGIDAIVVDYVRPSIFGTIVPEVAVGILIILSVVVFGSLCNFNYADIGIGQAVRVLWRL